MFGKVLKPGHDDSKENPQTIIFNSYYVPNTFVYALVLLIIEDFSLSLAIFWEKFLFKLSSGCDAYISSFDLCCFNWSDLSEINCLDEVPFSDVACLRLALDWSASFSATGGFFVVLSFLIVVIPWIVLKITKGDQATRKCKVTGKILRYFLIFILFNISIINFVVQIIINPNFQFQIAEFFQETGLFFTLIVIIAVPWWNFKKVINGVYMCDNNNMGSNVNGI